MYQERWDSVGQPMLRWAHSSGLSFCSYILLFCYEGLCPTLNSALFLDIHWPVDIASKPQIPSLVPTQGDANEFLLEIGCLGTC